MFPGYKPITLLTNADFSEILVWSTIIPSTMCEESNPNPVYPTPVNLTGYMAKLTIASAPGGTIYHTSYSENYPDSLNSEIIFPSLTSGQIQYSWTQAQIAEFFETFQTAVYDLLLVSAGGIHQPLIYGPFNITQGVTIP